MKPRKSSLLETTRSLSRGFTLIELLVAVVAGLVVSMAAFALSKQSSRFFHEETRLANAQFETLVGFERLRADIARAGYLSTPNVQEEPFHCRSPNFGNWFYGLKALGAVRIDTPTPHERSAANGRNPDRIFLTGSYTTDELFPVRAIQPGAGDGDQIFLNATFGPMQRLLRRTLVGFEDPEDEDDATAALQTAVLQEVFAAGRAIRVLDQAGTVSFGVIQSADLTGGNPRVVLHRTTPLPFVSTGVSSCGVAGNETGAQVSVINWIRYQLEPRGGTAEFPGDEGALQLVRQELDFTSVGIGSDEALTIGEPETVADFVVDMKFGLTHVAATSSPLNPELVTLAVGDATIPDVARDVSTGAATRGPQHIRSIRVRLSTRSRQADRNVGLGVAEGNVLYRYEVAENMFARVRTVTADIQLPNLAEVAW